MFEIGQKAVCIYKGPWVCADTQESVYVPTPRFNGVYVVIGIFSRPEERYLKFAEFPPHPGEDLPPGFSEHCFRPLEKKQTDISVFTEILKKAPAPGWPVREDAPIGRYPNIRPKWLDTIRPSEGLELGLPARGLCWREWVL